MSCSPTKSSIASIPSPRPSWKLALGPGKRRSMSWGDSEASTPARARTDSEDSLVLQKMESPNGSRGRNFLPMFRRRISRILALDTHSMSGETAFEEEAAPGGRARSQTYHARSEFYAAVLMVGSSPALLAAARRASRVGLEVRCIFVKNLVDAAGQGSETMVASFGLEAFEKTLMAGFRGVDLRMVATGLESVDISWTSTGCRVEADGVVVFSPLVVYDEGIPRVRTACGEAKVHSSGGLNSLGSWTSSMLSSQLVANRHEYPGKVCTPMGVCDM